MKQVLYWIDETFGIPERGEDWAWLIGVYIGIPLFCVWLFKHCNIFFS